MVTLYSRVSSTGPVISTLKTNKMSGHFIEFYQLVQKLKILMNNTNHFYSDFNTNKINGHFIGFHGIKKLKQTAHYKRVFVQLFLFCFQDIKVPLMTPRCDC